MTQMLERREEAPERAQQRAERRHTRDSVFILLGLVTITLIAAFVGQSPDEGLVAWEVGAVAAGQATPTAAEQVAHLLDALRHNVVLWRLVCLVIAGGIAGMMAKRVIPGSGRGPVGAVVLGVFGASLGGWVCEHAGLTLAPSISVLSIGVAFAGSVITLVTCRLIARI